MTIPNEKRICKNWPPPRFGYISMITAHHILLYELSKGRFDVSNKLNQTILSEPFKPKSKRNFKKNNELLGIILFSTTITILSIVGLIYFCCPKRSFKRNIRAERLQNSSARSLNDY